MMLNVDLSAVGKKAARKQIETILTDHPFSVQTDDDFWSNFLSEESAVRMHHTLVLCDLSKLVQRFRVVSASRWRASVRGQKPFFLAFVRNAHDREYVEWVDDIVKASDLRFDVCRYPEDTRLLSRCLFSALRNMEPDAITDTRYNSTVDSFWIQFGDGLNGILKWNDLNLGFLRNTVIPESVTPSTTGSSLEILQLDGEIFDIDSSVIRSVFDSHVKEKIISRERTHRAAFGSRLRQVRREHALTQTELGKRADLDQAVISRIERGKVRPRLDTLNRLADSLNVSLSRLLAEDL
jgi:DNA-binding XRE family transcriptional regulator